MHRTDAPGHINNKYQDGDPTGSPPIHPTIFRAAEANALQQELCRVIEYSGATLNNSSETDPYNQLVDAIGQSWVTFTTGASGSGISQLDNRNATASRDVDGIYTVTWGTDYANVNYCIVAVAGWTGSTTTDLICTITDVAVDSCKVRVFDTAGNPYQSDTMRVNVRATGTIATS